MGTVWLTPLAYHLFYLKRWRFWIHGWVKAVGKHSLVEVDVVFRPDKAEPYESLSLRRKSWKDMGTLDKIWKRNTWERNMEKKHGKKCIWNHMEKNP